jgi:hypothetical protein
MSLLRPALIAALLATSAVVAPSGAAFAQSCTCAGAGVRAERAPPPLPDYDQPPPPAEGYIWTPGYWAWNNVDYYWTPGTWVEPPHPGLLWTPGYWGFANGVYAFNPGYWAPHVGFYGGIAYGFGYFGSGYQGGRWNNGVFFYNRAANNIANARVTNVYNETIVNDVTINRVSFNGGNGGGAAKPTAEEEATLRGPRENPTNAQFEHLRAASMRAESFETTNHGRPSIAATPRPGALTDRNVVRAKPPGAPIMQNPAEHNPSAVEKTNGAIAPEKPDFKPAPPPKREEVKPPIANVPGKPDFGAKAIENPERRRPDARPPIGNGTPKDEPKQPPRSAPMQQMQMDRKPAPERERPGPDRRECGHPNQPACR